MLDDYKHCNYERNTSYEQMQLIGKTRQSRLTKDIVHFSLKIVTMLYIIVPVLDRMYIGQRFSTLQCRLW